MLTKTVLLNWTGTSYPFRAWSTLNLQPPAKRIRNLYLLLKRETENGAVTKTVDVTKTVAMRKIVAVTKTVPKTIPEIALVRITAITAIPELPTATMPLGIGQQSLDLILNLEMSMRAILLYIVMHMHVLTPVGMKTTYIDQVIVSFLLNLILEDNCFFQLASVQILSQNPFCLI